MRTADEVPVMSKIRVMRTSFTKVRGFIAGALVPGSGETTTVAGAVLVQLAL